MSSTTTPCMRRIARRPRSRRTAGRRVRLRRGQRAREQPRRRRRRGRRRRLDPDALDARAPREAGQPARRRVQRVATRTRSSSPSCRTTTTSPRSAPRPARTACPTSSPPTSSTCRTGSSRACSRTSRRNIDGLDFKDEINPGHLSAGTLDGKEHVLPFVLDLSMLFWNKDLFDRGRPRPREGAREPRGVRRGGQGHPGADKPDTYGTATGLNCGGCLVFTWFPSVWADGEEVHDRRRHRVAARERHRQGDLLHVEGPVGLGRRAPVVAGRGRAHLDRGLHRGQGRPHVLPRHAALVDAVRRGRRRHPRPRGRRVDVRRR